MAGTFTVTGMSAGELGGERVFGPITISGKTLIGSTFYNVLTSGDNTIAVPAGAVAALIIPPTGNITAIKVRTSANSGDAGLPINEGALPFVLPFSNTAPTSLILNSASATSAFCQVSFI